MEPRAIPEGLNVFSDRGAVVIRRKWKRSAAASILFLSATSLWPLLMAHHSSRPGNDDGPMVLDFLFHLTPALGAGYFAICSLVNRTDVIISSSRVRAVSTPLPWWGDRNISTREIYGVTVGKAKAREDGAKFCVMLIDRNGREQEFSRAGTGKEQVEFIGRAIADILNVEFKPLNENSPFKPWMKRINAWAASRGRAVGKMGKAQGA